MIQLSYDLAVTSKRGEMTPHCICNNSHASSLLA